MKSFFKLPSLILALLTGFISFTFTSCDDSKSYAELLTDEAHAINRFLADHRVINHVPENNAFETGPDAPYYRLDEDGNYYMQVLNPGTNTTENKVKYNDEVYFRYTRYNLNYYVDGELPVGDGNASNVAIGNYCFRFQNTTLQSTTQYGKGVQIPLEYLPIDCEVNLVMKSVGGPDAEIASVVPYVYHLRYFKSQI